LGTYWAEFQSKIFQLGTRTHKYIISYIASHKKRGQAPHLDGTLPLEKSITLDRFGGFGFGKIGFGIGNIEVLQKRSPHWYVINYGRMVTGQPFIPGRGASVPGYFQPSGRPDKSKSRGKEPFIYDPNSFIMTPKRVIRSMNYIESTQWKMRSRLQGLLLSLRRGTI
jgi:hypothetical protein